MTGRLLTPPRSVAEWVADGIRLLAPVSVIAAFVWGTPMDAGILALPLAALMVPRLVGVRSAFDIVFCVTILIAAWSNVLHLYESIPGWDLVVHFASTGIVAAMTYLVFARLELVPPPIGAGTPRATPLVLVTSFGLALAAVWEMIEWIGWRFVSDEIFVSYRDTIGDMAAGGLGGLVAGVVVARVTLLEEPE